MPIGPTFWSPRFGMVRDKFGMGWMVQVYNAEAAPPSSSAGNGEAGAVEPFRISRELDAPRARVWKAWTDRAELMKWFGPKGFTMPTATLDLRPGGTFHYCLRNNDGVEMWGKFVYREIQAPERTVVLSSFSDAGGNLTRHPWSKTWPLQMLSTTTFTERNGKTTMTVEWAPVNPTPEELKTFTDSRDGMRQGWTGTFEQLEQHLRTA